MIPTLLPLVPMPLAGSGQVSSLGTMGIFGLLALFLLGLLGFQFLNHRRKLKEMRLKTLESLARQGKISREDINRVLGNQGSIETPVVVLSWISFIVSLFFVALSQAEHRWRDGFLPAALVAVLSFAILSTPFLLRELRRMQEP